MKQGVGAEDRVVIELEIEVPKIGDPFQSGIASVGLKKLLPIFEHCRPNGERVGIWRGERGSAPNGFATGAAGAQGRSQRVADSAVVRKDEPRFFRWNLDDGFRFDGSVFDLACEKRDLPFAVASRQTEIDAVSPKAVSR